MSSEESQQGSSRAVPLVKIPSEASDNESTADHPLAASAVPEATPVTIPVTTPPPNTQLLTLDDHADAFLSGNSHRSEPILLPPPLPPHTSDLERLRVLVVRRAWGDALSVTQTLLHGTSSHYAPLYRALVAQPDPSSLASFSVASLQTELLEIMALQCHAWMHLRRWVDLARELEQWDFCDEEVRPDWVSPAFLVFAASLRSLVHKEATPQVLWNLRTACVDATSRVVVENALANWFIRDKEWRMALDALDRMLPFLPEAAKQEMESRPKGERATSALVLQHAYECEIWSRKGKILLQCGALVEAGKAFETADAAWKNMDAHGVLKDHNAVQTCPAQLQVNQGLLCFAYDKYDEALEFFRKGSELLRSAGNLHQLPMYRAQDYVNPEGPGSTTRQKLYAEAVNNIALCAVYTCRLGDATAAKRHV